MLSPDTSAEIDRPDFGSALPYAVIALTGFVAVGSECALGMYAAYLLGDPTRLFPLVLSVSLAGIGLGVPLSRREGEMAFPLFLSAHGALALATVGTPVLLYIAQGRGYSPLAVAIALALGTGAILGLQAPLLNAFDRAGNALSRLLFCEYGGGFAGGILFVTCLLPRLGFFRAAGALGAGHAIIALATAAIYHRELGGRPWSWLMMAILALAICLTMASNGESLRLFLEARP